MQIKRSIIAIIASLAVAAVPAVASAQVSVGVGIGFGGPGWAVGVVAGYPPPALPVYSMPPAPYPNWQWIPGYWALGAYGYYWVPGYWTAPPVVGYYWTPGYWNYVNGAYVWSGGYWGPSVGFYGGINYGFGYFGIGFVGGYWSGSVFNYNTAVVNVNRTVIHNTYVDPAVTHGTAVSHSRVSFNGGRGGIHARPTRAQIAAHRHAVAETSAQRAHDRAAARARGQLASVNHGHPRVVAVQKPVSTARALQTTRHGTVSATAHHAGPVAAAHHSQVSSSVTHSVRLQQGSTFHHVGMNTGRTSGGGSAHGSVHAAPPRGSVPHGGMSGGRPAGGSRPPSRR
jgi:hypothetical protein